MKSLVATLGVFFLPADVLRGALSTSAVREGQQKDPKEQQNAALREREGTAHVRELVDADDFYVGYQTGSCTCANDAYMAVQKAVTRELKMLPLVPGIFETIQLYLDRLVDYAVCAFHAIDCGCEDGSYGHKFKIFNDYKVSTYQCCCDIDAMRDIIITTVKRIATSWEIDMALNVDPQSVQKRFCFEMYNSELERTIGAVEKVGEIYNIPSTCDDFGAMCSQSGNFQTIPAQHTSSRSQPEEPKNTTAIGEIEVLTKWPVGSWAAYEIGPYSAGCKASIELEYNTVNLPTNVLELRLDSVNGKVEGVLSAPNTNFEFVTTEFPLSILPGSSTRTIYLVSAGTGSQWPIVSLKTLTIKLSSPGDT